MSQRPTRRIWHFEFKWYDLWVGAYWDRKLRILYVCPLPCLLITTWRQAVYPVATQEGRP